MKNIKEMNFNELIEVINSYYQDCGQDKILNIFLGAVETKYKDKLEEITSKTEEELYHYMNKKGNTHKDTVNLSAILDKYKVVEQLINNKNIQIRRRDYV